MTTLATLRTLIAQDESETLELKRSTAELKRAGETLGAFLNGEGSKVLIGVGPDGKLVSDILDNKPEHLHALAMVREAIAWLDRTLPRSARFPKGAFNREDRLPVPAEALHEIVINAVIHRDVSNPAQRRTARDHDPGEAAELEAAGPDHTRRARGSRDHGDAMTTAARRRSPAPSAGSRAIRCRAARAPRPGGLAVEAW
jgi:predicted HTH transcriptional regulator